MENTASDQAPVQSLTDKLAGMFGYPGDEVPNDKPDGTRIETEEERAAEAEAEAEAAAEVPAEPEDVEVELEGKRFKVPKDLEPAIMRQQDYTRKTQELAEHRRTLEQAQEAQNLALMEKEFAQSIAAESQQMAQLDSYLQSVNWQELHDAPVEESIKTFMQVQRAKDMRDSLKASIDQKRSEFSRDFSTAMEAHKGKVLELLAKQLPGFTRESVESIREYAQSQGFTKAAFDNIALDAKSMAVLHKAAQFDKLQAEKVAAVKQATPTVKPGASNPMPQQVRDKLAFNKAMKSAKTSQEKARLIEKKLAGGF